MRGRSEAAIAVLLFGAILLLVGFWAVAVWQECRAEGHTVSYCLALVSG